TSAEIVVELLERWARLDGVARRRLAKALLPPSETAAADDDATLRARLERPATGSASWVTPRASNPSGWRCFGVRRSGRRPLNARIASHESGPPFLPMPPGWRMTIVSWPMMSHVPAA